MEHIPKKNCSSKSNRDPVLHPLQPSLQDLNLYILPSQARTEECLPCKAVVKGMGTNEA